MKWISKALSILVVSSLIILPSWTYAEQKSQVKQQMNDAKKQEILRFFEKMDKRREANLKGSKSTNTKSSSQTVTATADATEVTYQGSIDVNETHRYHFDVKTSGKVSLQSSLREDRYMVVNYDSGVIYGDSDILPVGEYVLIVLGFDDVKVDYTVKISGVTFEGNPDTTLPNLKVTTPDSKIVRLPKGATSIQVKGTIIGTAYAELGYLYGFKQLESTFDETLKMDLGENFFYIYAENTLHEGPDNSVVQQYEVTAPGIKRLSGADRYETSANISKHLREVFDREYPVTVVIARGDLFPDALSGAPLARWNDAPILLTKTASLPTKTKDEIKRLQAKQAIILGGTGAVSTNVETELKQLGVTTVERISGKDRYAVSTGIANRVIGITQNSTAIVVSGQNYPDALSASSPAGVKGMPILLVKKDTIPASIDQFIRSHSRLKNFIIVGGEGVVSKAIADKLKSYRNGKVDRIGGVDRYDTSARTLDYFAAEDAEEPFLNTSVFVIARGDDFPDALAGGPFAASWRAPILLTPPTQLAPKIEQAIQSYKPDGYYILGGTGAISSAVENKLDSYIQ